MDDILAVVGSTKFDGDMHGSYVAFNFLMSYMNTNRPDQVISGGAIGLDSIGIQVANLLDISYRNFLPNNNRWEPDGYKARNIEIITNCTRLVCIRHFDAQTYGSGWTADQAEKVGKYVERFVCKPNYEIEKL
jgi:hypothetical protein